MNKGFVKLSVIFATLLGVVALTGYLVSARNVKAFNIPQIPKVEFCHWTDGNEYELKDLPWVSIFPQGHNNHDKDIIPSFGQYPGKNWDTEGQEILRNGCEVPDKPEDLVLPYVELVGTPACNQVELEFGADPQSNPALALFEYRIDGQADDQYPGEYQEFIGQNHPRFGIHAFVEDQTVYPQICVDGNGVFCPEGPKTRVFTAKEKVEVRLAIGSEKDWDFGWQTFEVPGGCAVPDQPQPEQPKSEPSPAGAPVCPNGVPALVPANPHVVRNSSTATVNAHIPEGNQVNVYYRENSETDWTHALRDVPVSGNYLSVQIHDLDPNLGYTFGIQAANGCAGGETVLAVIIDPPAEGETFMFSYWLWQ